MENAAEIKLRETWSAHRPACSRITAEGIRDIRARAWAFAFECYAKRKAAHPGDPDTPQGESG
jgi:hypothetical protein